ncbi:MAG: MFS transporter [Nocardioides sp.]|uniref:MFS transporter n=1 Tax=Nocardioides sp. TaxID=35761 RepID=UPI0039E5E3FB
MSFATYADLARIPAVRQILLLGLCFRIPMTASSVLVTLHVVGHLHRSYAEAGVVTTVLALGLAGSSPWRGRMLDRLGLRRALLPSIVVLALAWTIAPWVGYWPLVVLVGVAGMFMVPSFSIVRQVLLSAVTPGQRTAVLSIDSMVTEASFMLGPILGVLAATYLPTTAALMICQWFLVASAIALWVANPPLRAPHPDHPAPAGSARTDRRLGWMTPGVVLLLVATFTASLILTSEDLGSVAAMRQLGHPGSLGWVLALWASGSLVGAVVYGALQRHPPASVLLILLGATTALVSLAPDRTWFAILIVISGLFCAPTLTATVADLTQLVPARVRGELMGWHGSAMTLGSALGAPLVGTAIDSAGWDGAFALGGLLGLAIALVVLAFRRTGTGRSAVDDVAPRPPAPPSTTQPSTTDATLR